MASEARKAEKKAPPVITGPENMPLRFKEALGKWEFHAFMCEVALGIDTRPTNKLITRRARELGVTLSRWQVGTVYNSLRAQRPDMWERGLVAPKGNAELRMRVPMADRRLVETLHQALGTTAPRSQAMTVLIRFFVGSVLSNEVGLIQALARANSVTDKDVLTMAETLKNLNFEHIQTKTPASTR